MRFKLFLAFSLLVPLTMICQQSVFVKAKQNGNGFSSERNGECYIITPNHVVLENLGNIKIVAKNRLELEGKLIESFEPDLAILKLGKSSNFRCKPLKKLEGLNAVMDNSSTGVLEYRDEFGAINIFHVDITYIDQESITVIPKNPEIQLIKGMSGSSLYVTYKGDKILLGMLMSITENLKTGYVYQIDDINRMLSPFFDVEKTKPKKLGILILKDGVNFTEVTNRLTTNLQAVEKYQTSKKLPNAEFIYKEFNSIVEGRLGKQVPKKIKESVDELLLGEVTLSKSINSKNLYKINARLAANLYSSSDFTLIKNVNANGKGLNSDENLAYEQSIKSLLNNLQNQLK